MPGVGGEAGAAAPGWLHGRPQQRWNQSRSSQPSTQFTVRNHVSTASLRHALLRHRPAVDITYKRHSSLHTRKHAMYESVDAGRD